MAVARLRQDWSESTELTKREMGVLRCAADGLSRQETATKLFLADATISHHRKSIFQKLDAKTIAHAVALAYECKLFEIKQKVPEEIVFGGVRYLPVKEVK